MLHEDIDVWMHMRLYPYSDIYMFTSVKSMAL